MSVDVKNNLFLFDKKKLTPDIIKTVRQVFPSKTKKIEKYSQHRQADIIAGLYLMYKCLDNTSENSLVYTSYGRAIIDGFESFSISHSHDLAVLSLYPNDDRVGIDIEYIRDVNEGLIKKVCLEKELSFVKKKAIF